MDVGSWRGRSDHLGEGDSISVGGVCLTVAQAELPQLEFDVVTETLNCSTLGTLKAGHYVNLESSLIASTPIGGHFVQGHVDGVGYVTDVQKDEQDESSRIAVRPPAELMEYLTPKGSVAIEGVSMTLAGLTDEVFELALIPTTLALTTLGMLKVGDGVNLETDMVNRAVVHWLRRQLTGEGADQPANQTGGVDWRTLREAGFID